MKAERNAFAPPARIWLVFLKRRYYLTPDQNDQNSCA